jgi:exopolysaccharide production protein ExoQ
MAQGPICNGAQAGPAAGHASERTSGAAMPIRGSRHRDAPQRWEWLWIAACLVILSGAVIPLLMLGPDGSLDEASRAKLRLLSMPVYAGTILLLMRWPARLLDVVCRNWPLALLLLLALLSALWSVAPGLTVRRAIALMMSVSLAYLIAIRFSPRDQIRLLAWVLCGCTLTSLLVGLALPSLGRMPGDPAFRGVFVHKNVLGWLASFSVLLGLAALHDRSAARRRAGWIILAIGWAGTLLSASVTSFFAASLTVVMAYMAGMISRRHGLARLCLGLALILGAAAFFVLLALSLVPLLETLGKDATLTGRIPLWKLIDPEIAARPMLGHGYGAFWSEGNHAAWRIWGAAGWEAPHAHNGYRDLMLGVGLVGTGLFAVMILRAMKQAFDLYLAAPEEGWLWCILAIWWSLVLNLSESTFLMQSDLMWLLLAIAVVTVSRAHAEARYGATASLRRMAPAI